LTYRSEALDPDRHHLDALDSGEPYLDQWLQQHAASAEARRVSRTFVWVNDEDVVVAYYSLSGHILVRDQIPKSLGRGMPVEIPVVLLGRLALDTSLHGQRLGAALLSDALARAVISTYQVAARFVVVDALHDKAAAFYEHHGFKRIPETLRPVQKVADIEVALTHNSEGE
jgi:predicted N-acetyltransferase YhbS